MKRSSVDIGGTFTDCFVAWGDRYVQSKALTTHHNLALGFNEALEEATSELDVDTRELLSGVDSVRYSTTLGTNALIDAASLADNLSKVLAGDWKTGQKIPLWDGNTAERAVAALERRTREHAV